MTKLKAPRKSFADRAIMGNKVRKVLATNKSEYLTGCALIRDDVLHGPGRAYRSHAELRQAIGDTSIYTERPGDESGFMTNTGRFVGRLEASTIAVLANQAAPMYEGRDIFSGDITWRTTK